MSGFSAIVVLSSGPRLRYTRRGRRGSRKEARVREIKSVFQLNKNDRDLNPVRNHDVLDVCARARRAPRREDYELEARRGLAACKTLACTKRPARLKTQPEEPYRASKLPIHRCRRALEPAPRKQRATRAPALAQKESLSGAQENAHSTARRGHTR